MLHERKRVLEGDVIDRIAQEEIAVLEKRIKELELALLSNVRQEAENARLLDVVKQVYLKHSTDSEQAMGWDELGNLLHTTLCNAMGDDGYWAWMEEKERQEEKP